MSNETIERGSLLLFELVDFDIETCPKTESITNENSLGVDAASPRKNLSRPPICAASGAYRGCEELSTSTCGPSEHAPGSRYKTVVVRYVLQLPRKIPDDFCHPLIDAHPWGHLVLPQTSNWSSLRERDITGDMPDQDYRHIPDSGYSRYQFAKWFFPF
ncbi:unnamed protein product [Cylicostephanus goldi]|uniref:Uncharacterized protein n=1 Tax=Cylicostephanus goldi TaxID=71465 RepID=A0A3P6SAH6_CYLGO|nr:unnamed protein product [Cylicostephanus goldi]